MFVHTAGDASAFAPRLRQLAADADPTLHLSDFRRLDRVEVTHGEEHAPHLVDGDGRILQIAEDALNDHGIESLVGERELMGIADGSRIPSDEDICLDHVEAGDAPLRRQPHPDDDLPRRQPAQLRAVRPRREGRVHHVDVDADVRRSPVRRSERPRLLHGPAQRLH